MEQHQQDKIILVHIQLPETQVNYMEDQAEFKDLVRSTGAEIKSLVTGKRAAPSAKYFVGNGKAEEIGELVQFYKADLVIFNHELTPAQERNLEKLLQCRVLDRTGLILDIFASRARSFEGRLQVELAQLQHLSTRLVRGWTHLERQKGGIGLRGPGETQLETDRRLLGNRIKFIKKRLEKVRSQRQQGRRARQKAEIPTVSLVGYTNAGKSTLFNKLTEAKVYAADQLFATLDPTLRRVEIPELGAIILVDTVGFIRDLPHDLVDAFRATLEETLNADLLLHIVDSHDAQRREKIAAVNDVLKDINAETMPQLLVYNKIDLLEKSKPRIDYDGDNKPSRVRVSALSSAGFDVLLEAIRELLASDIREYEFVLNPSQGKLRAKLYEIGTVLKDDVDENGNWIMSVRLQQHEFKLFSHNYLPIQNR